MVYERDRGWNVGMYINNIYLTCFRLYKDLLKDIKCTFFSSF